MNWNIKQFIGKMELNSPATKEILDTVEAKLGMEFPDQYVEFMLESNGTEGQIGSNSYLTIWPAEQIIHLNEEYAVKEFTPGLVYFGSDGGSMVYAFDIRVQIRK